MNLPRRYSYWLIKLKHHQKWKTLKNLNFQLKLVILVEKSIEQPTWIFQHFKSLLAQKDCFVSSEIIRREWIQQKQGGFHSDECTAVKFIDVICISNIYTIFYSSQLDSHFRSLFRFNLFYFFYFKSGRRWDKRVDVVGCLSALLN